ncbi:hypothetical protein RFI_17441 [Reticulomyxa filosa]|uniref:Uncharacterized protein n=1 Tax=Reticulomyxa filosa TaxID=46433 RepID=X6N1K5_RETFI|nr:hypothetical protein RFI_17441 [Reticulomyxa filosa]|eukprot:ETO19788.1 hypothetical protein RFI_17441 [Reticulomyxa filosa]
MKKIKKGGGASIMNIVMKINRVRNELKKLFEEFGNEVDDRMILYVWCESGEMYEESRARLGFGRTSNAKNVNTKSQSEASSKSKGSERKTAFKKRKNYETILFYLINTSRSTERVEIVVELCSYILWNILTQPSESKYRQISNEALKNLVQKKCKRKDEIKSEGLYQQIIRMLANFGFIQSYDNNWYFGFFQDYDGEWYHHREVDVMHIWEAYCLLYRKYY